MRMKFEDAKSIVLQGSSKEAADLDRLAEMLRRRPLVAHFYMFDDGRRPMLRLVLGRAEGRRGPRRQRPPQK